MIETISCPHHTLGHAQTIARGKQHLPVCAGAGPCEQEGHRPPGAEETRKQNAGLGRQCPCDERKVLQCHSHQFPEKFNIRFKPQREIAVDVTERWLFTAGAGSDVEPEGLHRDGLGTSLASRVPSKQDLVSPGKNSSSHWDPAGQFHATSLSPNEAMDPVLFLLGSKEGTGHTV